MKNFIISITLLTVFSFLFGQENQKKSARLEINIEGLQNNKGKVLVAVNDSEENYSDHDGEVYKGAVAKIADKKAVVVFNDIPFGVYAVKVFHDENDNGELDSNFMHIPQEPYGFSNNARGTFGPASWDDAKFEIKTDSLAISIMVE